MPLVKEVILENFMSYRYARIPLEGGVNLITGPNGSGKSSILLGISVALGQTYTERGRRLSDLIRKGERYARATVVLDNRPRGRGSRPIPSVRGDEVFISRYIRSDGQYWHEVNGRTMTKSSVRRMLSKLCLDPDNPLIIMHQNMMEEFSVLSPQDKLKVVEGAVGLSSYRKRILRARETLLRVEAEEREVETLLSKAEETLNYWTEMSNKLKKKRKLEEKLSNLRRELAWTRVFEKEKKLSKIVKETEGLESELKNLEERMNNLSSDVKDLEESIGEVEAGMLDRRIGLKEGLLRLRNLWESAADKIGEVKVSKVLIEIKRDELGRLKEEVRRARRRIKELASEAEKLGGRLFRGRNPDEIEEEMRRVEISLAGIGRIPRNTDEACSKYREIYERLRKRAEEVQRNKRRLVKEIEDRMIIWREKLTSLLETVNPMYREILSRMGGDGEVRIINLKDPEKAGIELLISFSGSDLSPLDPLSHSGGERTSAVMSFFLALQSCMESPFRAVDEFDTHMDLRNRGVIFRSILELARSGIQYLVITPVPPSDIPDDVHVLVVQKVRGESGRFLLEEA